MKYIRKINEYALEEPPFIEIAPKRRAASDRGEINRILHKIIDRYNSLISKGTNESLEDNLGIPKEYLDRIKASLPSEEENLENLGEDTTEILRLLAAIREIESNYEDADKKEKALDIVYSIFKGHGLNLDDVEFDLEIIKDSDLFKWKNPIIGKSTEEFKEIKKDIRRNKPKLAKEIDIRAIQNALSQGFSSAVKDDFAAGDQEIQGVGFEDYYSFMSKVFNQYSKIPVEYIHQALVNAPALGSAKLRWDEDKKKYVVEAKGYTILVLVHEMVKGIYELMSYHREMTDMSAEDENKVFKEMGTQHMEREGLIYGPAIARTFKDFFNRVESNLKDDGVIENGNPAMLAAILQRFYKETDDSFLRICSALWNKDDDDSLRPYEEFEQYYKDELEGKPIGGRSNDSSLDDLLSGAGISLNFNPIDEKLKYIFSFETLALLEGFKEQVERFTEQGNEAEDVAVYVNWFQRLTRMKKPNDELKNAMVADMPGVEVPKEWNDRKDIDRYKSFDELRRVVDAGRKVFPLPLVSTLQAGDVGPAVIQIQKILGLQVTGWYGGDLEKEIKSFQEKFKEEVSPEMLQSFYNDTINLKSTFANQLKNLAITREKRRAQGLNTMSIDTAISEMADKIVTLEEETASIKSALTGGLKEPSGKMDTGTISAFMADKGISKLEGIKGDLGTLKPVGGKIVLETDDYRIWRNQSLKFCIEAREKFENTLISLGADRRVYNWCISWEGGATHYPSFRFRAGHNQTIYFIENKKRAIAEYARWTDFKNETETSLSGLKGIAGSGVDAKYKKYIVDKEGMDDAAGEEIIDDSSRRYFDNYHIAVIFVSNLKNDDGGEHTYWAVSASNDGEWGNYNTTTWDDDHFSFKHIADRIWPSNQDESIRVPARGTVTKAPQVPQSVIDASYYHNPTEGEFQEIKNAILPVSLSPIEKEEKEDEEGSSRRNQVDADEFKEMPYEEKESYLNTKYWTDHEVRMKDRNNKRIPIDFWKVMPNSLKSKHIANSWTGMDDEMFDVIKNEPRLIEQHKEFLRRRLYGDGGRGGLIENLKDVEKLTNSGSILGDMSRHMLNPMEIKLVAGLDLEKLKIKINNIKIKLKIIEAGSKNIDLVDADMISKIVNSYYENNKRYKKSNQYKELLKELDKIIIKLKNNKLSEGYKKELNITKDNLEKKVNVYEDLGKRYLDTFEKVLRKALSIDPSLKTDSDYLDMKKFLNVNKMIMTAKYEDPLGEEIAEKIDLSNFHNDSTKIPVLKSYLAGKTNKDFDKKISEMMQMFYTRLVLSDLKNYMKGATNQWQLDFDKLKNIYSYIIKLDSPADARYLFNTVKDYYNLDGAKRQNRQEDIKLFKLHDRVIDIYDKKYNDVFTKKYGIDKMIKPKDMGASARKGGYTRNQEILG